MGSLKLERQRFPLLHTNLVMKISQVAIYEQVNQQYL